MNRAGDSPGAPATEGRLSFRFILAQFSPPRLPNLNPSKARTFHRTKDLHRKYSPRNTHGGVTGIPMSEKSKAPDRNMVTAVK